jgi:hypothetical protein
MTQKRQPKGIEAGGQFAPDVNAESTAILMDEPAGTATKAQLDEAAKLRESANASFKSAEDSFQRCDTDGFLSQWASGLTGQLKNRQAAILENGGLADFAVLLDVNTDEFVPAKLIDGRYGRCWALLGDDGKFTGQFIKAFPARESTMAKKGFKEARGLFPAFAKMDGSGHGLSGSAWVATFKACDELTAPIEIVQDEDESSVALAEVDATTPMMATSPEVQRGQVFDTVIVTDGDYETTYQRRRHGVFAEWPDSMRFQVNRPLTDEEFGRVAGLVGYAYRATIAGESVSPGAHDSPYSFIVHADMTKTARDDFGMGLEDFEEILPHVLAEGSPIRKTDRAGAGTKGTRLIEGLGSDLTVEIYYNSVFEYKGDEFKRTEETA